MNTIRTAILNAHTRKLILKLNVRGWTVEGYGFSSRCHATRFVATSPLGLRFEIPTIQTLHYLTVGIVQTNVQLNGE